MFLFDYSKKISYFKKILDKKFKLLLNLHKNILKLK